MKLSKLAWRASSVTILVAALVVTGCIGTESDPAGDSEAGDLALGAEEGEASGDDAEQKGIAFSNGLKPWMWKHLGTAMSMSAPAWLQRMADTGWSATDRYDFNNAGVRCAYSNGLNVAPEWAKRAVSAANKPRLTVYMAMFVNVHTSRFMLLNNKSPASAETEAKNQGKAFEGCFGWNGGRVRMCYGKTKSWTSVRHGGFSGFSNGGVCSISPGSSARCTAI